MAAETMNPAPAVTRGKAGPEVGSITAVGSGFENSTRTLVHNHLVRRFGLSANQAALIATLATLGPREDRQ